MRSLANASIRIVKSMFQTVNPVECFTVGATNRIDMDALDNMQGIPVLHVNVASEEKPWRIAGKWP